MTRQHIERALAHGAGGAEDGDADHSTTPSSVSPSSSTGAAPVRLSMRSMTPPCPGNTLPLSFTPAKRFSRLSVRSPIIEKPTAARHSGRNAANDTWNHRLPAIATTALTPIAPNTPSQVFPGDTFGARRMRPKRRPQKNAPMSATHTSSSANSTHCAPCGSASRSRTRASHAGTSASTPAAPADQGATRRGANAIHSSAISHHSTATLSSRSRPSGVAETRHAPSSSTATSSTYALRSTGLPSSRNADHSQAPASTSSVTTPTVTHAGSQSTMASSTAPSTTAVRTRLRSASVTMPLRPRRGLSRCGVAEAPFTSGEERERVLEIRHREIRPQPRTEIQLRVGEIPEQEVADAVLTAGADQQVRLRQSREHELRGEAVLVDIFRPYRATGPFSRKLLSRLDNTPAPAVTHGHL